jgi:DNA-binding NtrC family response regulator
VRELSNVVERLVILCNEGRVGRAHLLHALPESAGVESVPATAGELNEAKKKLREEAILPVEKAFLTEALRRSDYNVTKAADDTGMQRTNFQALLKKHNLRIKDLVGR